MPGFFGSQIGSAMRNVKSPAEVSVEVAESGVAGVNVGPSVGVGVLVEGGTSVDVGLTNVGDGAGVFVYSGSSVEAQLATPCPLASSTMLRMALSPELVLAKLVRASSQAVSATTCHALSRRSRSTT